MKVWILIGLWYGAFESKPNLVELGVYETKSECEQAIPVVQPSIRGAVYCTQKFNKQEQNK